MQSTPHKISERQRCSKDDGTAGVVIISSNLLKSQAYHGKLSINVLLIEAANGSKSLEINLRKKNQISIFDRRGKLENSEKNLSKQSGREPPNSTHILHEIGPQ